MTGSGLSGRGLTVLLGAITALTPAAMDIYLVSMPSLTEAFGASTTAVQMTIAVYLLGNAVGQLFWGSLSDRFGRRPVLLSGLALFGVAAVACAAAPSIEMLIAARLVQGVGISAGLVITRAIVRDCYDGDRAASVLALMSMITGIAPLLAPIVGSALQSAFGWRAIFVCIALCAAIVFASALLLLEETLAEPDGEATRPSIMLRNFSQMLSNATFVGNAIVVCAVTGGLIAFLASSSFVFVRSLGYAEQNFGFVFGLTMVGNIVGASFGRHLVGLLGIERTISAGTVLAMTAGLAMVALVLAGFAGPVATILPVMVFVFSFAVVLPPATAAAMAPFAAHAGAASSLLGSLALVFSGVVGGAVGACFDGTSVPLALGLAAMGTLAFLAHRFMVRGHPSAD